MSLDCDPLCNETHFLKATFRIYKRKSTWSYWHCITRLTIFILKEESSKEKPRYCGKQCLVTQ